MTKLTVLFVTLFLLGIHPQIFSQISHGGQPRGRQLLQKKSLAVIDMPSAEINWDTIQHTSKKKDLIGKVFEVNYTPINSGTWTQLEGGKLWRLVLRSGNAKSVGVAFSEFELTEGCEVFSYSNTNSSYIGAFTHLNNSALKALTLQPISGDEVTIELWQPDHAYQPVLRISEVHHIYKTNPDKKSDLVKKTSDFCHIDINCSQGNTWQIEKQSVVMLSITQGSSRFACTGAMINNTSQDKTPYILTANHCITSAKEAKTVLCYFGNEIELCDGTGGNKTQSISTSYFRATPDLAKLDFTLVELSKTPPREFHPYYAGWDLDTNPPSASVIIHHPNGDVKKISKDNDNATEYGRAPYSWDDDDYSHWKVYWDEGSSQGGSSGAPVFNTNHQIIGVLVGGSASCDFPKGEDLVTKFHLAWNKYPKQDNSLHNWLDPISSGANSLRGLDPYKNDIDIAIDEIVYPKGNIRPNETIQPIIAISNEGNKSILGFEVTIYLDGIKIGEQERIGVLGSGGVTYVEMPEVVNFGTGVLEAKVNVFTDKDTYQLNNIASVTIQHSLGDKLNFELPNQNEDQNLGWEVFNNMSESLYKHSYFSNQIADEYPFVLEAGCYRMELYRPNEINPQQYILRNETDDVVLRAGIIFPANKGFDFCTTTVPTTKVEPENFYSLITVTNETIHCRINSQLPTQACLYDMSGHILEQWAGLQGEQSLILPAGLSSGVYVLRIDNGQEVGQERFVYDGN